MNNLLGENAIDNTGEHVQCKLCNTVVIHNYQYSINSHIGSYNHRTNIAEIENIIAGEFIKYPCAGNGLLKCSLCNARIHFDAASARAHIEDPQHRSRRAAALRPLNGIFSVNGNDNKLWCKVCSEYFDSSVDDILEHVDEDPEHGRRLSLIEPYEDDDLDFNSYLDSFQGKVRCTRCDVVVNCTFDNDLYDLQIHVDGYNHSRE